MKQTRNNYWARCRGLLVSICVVAIMGLAQPVMAQEKEVKSAVKTGNDPRDFAHKITPYWRHDKRRGGIETDDAVLFFMVPFSFPGTATPSAITFESPLYRWQDIDGVGSESGLSDWTLRLILKPFQTDFLFDWKASHVFFLETTVPTGESGISNEQTLLSVGYGPIASNSPNWFFAPIFFYDKGVENKGPAEDVDRLRGRIFYQYAWKNGVYVLPEMQVIYDFNEDEFTMNVLPELGWVFKRPPKLESSLRPNQPPGNALYVKGGPGVSNSERGDLDWRLEIGLRFLW